MSTLFEQDPEIKDQNIDSAELAAQKEKEKYNRLKQTTLGILNNAASFDGRFATWLQILHKDPASNAAFVAAQLRGLKNPLLGDCARNLEVLFPEAFITLDTIPDDHEAESSDSTSALGRLALK